MTNAQEQLNEVRERQLQADLNTLEDPKGFSAPYFVVLFAMIATGDLPGVWGTVAPLVSIVIMIGLIGWRIRSRGAAPSRRYSNAIAVPTMVFTVAAIAVVIAANIVLKAIDAPAPGVVTAFLFTGFAYFGMKRADAATRRRLVNS